MQFSFPAGWANDKVYMQAYVPVLFEVNIVAEWQCAGEIIKLNLKGCGNVGAIK
jgi:hypothetical protein